MMAEHYRDQLLALLPQGAAWLADQGSNLSRLFHAWGDELARVDLRADDLIEETDPRSTNELLTDWERVAGLPDSCTDAADTLEERRNALVARLTAVGGQSPQYFIDVAAALGYTITITEYREHTVGSDVDAALNNQPWVYAWRVNAPESTVTYHNVESGVDEPLADWGNQLLECLINRLAPAHTNVLFAYGG